MRLWSLDPSQLDRVGLVALWREGLLAQKVLQGKTKGYRFHPQLNRFRETGNPVAAIGAYLSVVAAEAEARGYRFDASKIAVSRRVAKIAVTEGQLEFEWAHLRRKLRGRDRRTLRELRLAQPRPNPILRVIPGGIEPWEAV